MKVEEFRRLQARRMTEAELQNQVVAMAKRLGWLCYHTFDSRRSTAGYPDLHLVHPTGVSVFRELKSETGVVSPAQRSWIAALTAAGCDAGVWRPKHLLAGDVEATLRIGRRKSGRD